MTPLPPAALQALEAFSAQHGWEQRARLLMQWGQQLHTDETVRQEENRVHGCESQVWLSGEQKNALWYFQADSDARLLRGLLALLLARVNGLTTQQLTEIDMTAWFEQLGLARQLSPSRSNGLNAVVQQIQRISKKSQ